METVFLISITGDKISSIVITNTIGQQLLSTCAGTRGTTINIAALPAGIYLVIITGNTGQKSVAKLIRQ